MIQYEQNIHTYINEWVGLNKFSGNVFVAQKGKVVFNKSYGLASHTYDVANRTQTKFHLASLTKQFTAAALFLLVQKGRIKLNDTLSIFMPDYPQGDQVKIRHLLNHTAGVPNILELPGTLDDIALPLTLNQVVAKFKDKPLAFAAGSAVDYSNSGYILLAAIIEKITGQPFELFLKENIFEPIGMKDTGFLAPSVIIKNLASGYGVTEHGLVNAPFYVPRNLVGALGLYSTVEDLYLWDTTLRNNKILSPELNRQMLASSIMHDNTFVGSGWMIKDVYGHRCIWHNGCFFDTHVIMCRFVDDDICLIILCNIDWTKSPIEQITEDIAAILFGKSYKMPLEQQKPVSLSLDEAKQYVGTYRYTYYSFSEVLMKIFIQNDELFFQIGDMPPSQMLPKYNGRLFFKLFASEVSFPRNEGGRIDKLILNYGGDIFRHTFEAKRISNG